MTVLVGIECLEYVRSGSIARSEQSNLQLDWKSLCLASLRFNGLIR